jgi:hypothetical protein
MIPAWATIDIPVKRRGDTVVAITVKNTAGATVDLSAYAGRIYCAVYAINADRSRGTKLGDATITQVSLAVGRFNITFPRAVTAAIDLARGAGYDVVFDEPSGGLDIYRLDGRLLPSEGFTEVP